MLEYFKLLLNEDFIKIIINYLIFCNFILPIIKFIDIIINSKISKKFLRISFIKIYYTTLLMIFIPKKEVIEMLEYFQTHPTHQPYCCLLYTSDAADE